MSTTWSQVRQFMTLMTMLGVILVALTGCSSPSQGPAAEIESSGQQTSPPSPPTTAGDISEMIDPADAPPDRPCVTMETTAGDITLELYSNLAPANVQRFLSLMDSEFYTQPSEEAQSPVTVHRVIAHKRFYSGIYDIVWTARRTESVFNESDNGLKNTRGTLAMTPQDPADPDSAECGFVIHAADAPELDYQGQDHPGLTVIGRVVAGMDTVDAIVNYTLIDLHMGNHTFTGVPVSPIFIEKINRCSRPQ